MLFILLTIVYIFLAFIALFGDYEEKELKKDEEYYNKIVGKEGEIIE